MGMKTFEWAECSFDPTHLRVEVGESRLESGSAHGHLDVGDTPVRWTLNWEGGGLPALLLKPTLYRGGFPKAKSVVPRPMVRFSGEISVGETTWSIADWTGSQNHNWGIQHTDSYAWGQVAGFDDYPDWFLECASARLQYGPIWTPAFTVAVLRTGQREIRFDGLIRAVRASAAWSDANWQWRVTNGAETPEARFQAEEEDWIVFPYRNPPGGMKTCRNSKVAAVEITLQESNGTHEGNNPESGAFEILR